MKDIIIKGAREHNLKNIDVTLPRDKFIMALEENQPPGRVPHFELLFLVLS